MKNRGDGLERVEFETNPRVVKVELSEQCTVIYKPEFIIKSGKLSKDGFNSLWKKYMKGEINLK